MKIRFMLGDDALSEDYQDSIMFNHDFLPPIGSIINYKFLPSVINNSDVRWKYRVIGYEFGLTENYNHIYTDEYCSILVEQII